MRTTESERCTSHWHAHSFPCFAPAFAGNATSGPATSRNNKGAVTTGRRPACQKSVSKQKRPPLSPPFVTSEVEADGDALVLPTETLLVYLAAVKKYFPNVTRVASYGTAQDVLRKTPEELRTLRDAGLGIVYLGAETGDDEILRYINKGVTAQEILAAGKKLKECGIATSVTLISGLGGRDKVERHALSCAELISGMNPEYASFLTLRLYEGTPFYDDVVAGRFERITPDEIMDEMEIFLKHVDSPGTIFRTNHASNYVLLAGTLNEDIPEMLEDVRQAREAHRYRRFRETGDLL